MSLLISMLGIVGTSMTIYSGSLNIFIFQLGSIFDTLSLSLIWLSSGVILAMFSSTFLKFSNILWWMLITALILSFTSTSLFYFYIFFEMSLIPILLMILSLGSQPERLSAGSYLMFYTTAVSIPYLVLIILMDLTEFGMLKLCYSSSGMTLLLVIPFFIKMPLFGFHFWLPKAHVEASTGGSMVLAGMLLKLGGYGAARVMGLFYTALSFTWYSSVWMLLALLSGLVTFMQSDLKKLVAYSSVTHMTFMVVGLTTNSKLMLISVVLVSLSHGWAAMAMFASAGNLSNSASSRLGTLVSVEASLFWMMILLGFILISNSGVPPMPSFFPEVFMVLSSMTTSGYSMSLFLFLSMAVCYYNAYLFLWISHMKPSFLISGKVSFMEGFVLMVLILLSVESLFWIQLF